MTQRKFANILTEVGNYYTGKLQEHGTTAKGVDWNSEESQGMRFRQLLKVADGVRAFTLNDIGCGFGFLSEYLDTTGVICKYFGADISPEMIATAQQKYGANTRAKFVGSTSELPVCDFSVASGIFNVRLKHEDKEWKEYVAGELAEMNKLSTRGFAFNMLTSYSDADKKRPDLYYADPAFYFDYCKRNFSKQVALLHDYGLFEFTIVVRKET